MQATTLPLNSVDSHAHVFLKDLPWSEGRRYAPSYDAPAERYLSELAAHEVSRGVLIQPSFLGTDNQYLVDSLERYPDQLRGVVVLDPERGVQLVEEYHAKGVTGIRENLIGKPLPDFNSASWQNMLARMRALDWHLEVQLEAARLAQITPVILKSGVRLVVDHFGRLDPELGAKDPALPFLVELGRTQQVWVKISGAYRISPRRDGALARETAQAAYALLKTTFGVHRMVWGSDWPHTAYEDSETFSTALRTFNEIVTDPMERHAILAGTPGELFHFPD